MPRRNSPSEIRDLDDLSHLDQIVVDKRRGQRSDAKKNRRNRHYEKQFIRHALARRVDSDSDSDSGADSQ
jgi:hypothetical protein